MQQADILTVKKELTTLKLAKKEMDERFERYQRAKANLTHITASYSMAPAHGSGDNSKIESGIVALSELEKASRESVEAYIDKFHEINVLINSLEKQALRIILSKRYIDFQRWEKIAEDTNYSIQHIYRLHKQGLIELTKIPRPVMTPKRRSNRKKKT